MTKQFIMTNLLLLTFAFGLVACKSNQKGTSSGRVDPYETTYSDQKAKEARLPDLMQFADQTAQKLAMDLMAIDNFKNAPGKLVIEHGDLLNKTQTPTQDFEMIQRRLRATLMRSPEMRNKFIFVESAARMEHETRRVNLEQGEAGRKTSKYSPAITYVLQGDFYEAKRGVKQQFFFEFKLTNLQTREMVFSDIYDLAVEHD